MRTGLEDILNVGCGQNFLGMHPSEQQEAFVLKYIVDQWIPTHLHFLLLLGGRTPGDCDKPLRNERFDTKKTF